MLYQRIEPGHLFEMAIFWQVCETRDDPTVLGNQANTCAAWTQSTTDGAVMFLELILPLTLL